MVAASHLALPHHDPSVRWVSNTDPTLGEVVRVVVEAPDAEMITLRAVRDGEAFWHQATRQGNAWVFELPCTQQVVNYRFLVRDEAGDRWLTAAGIIDWDPPDFWDFKLLVDLRAPTWVPGTVWYQIFPDRFETTGRHRRDTDWATWSAWDDPIASGPVAMRQLYGGDLDGIVARLDHLVDLGITGIYLTPVFPARSNHRYDATSFDEVDPILGGDEALVRLSNAAAERGIRVIADITLNHTGDHHEWFMAAQADAASDEAGWFHFNNHPDDYVAWMNVPTLPKVDHRDPALRARFYEGTASVMRRYLEPPFNMAGWRVDVANMTGRLGMLDMSHEIARIARRTVEQPVTGAEETADGGRWLVGEHFHDAIPDAQGDGWHGVMNYGGVSRPVASWLGKGDQLVAMTAGPGVAARNGIQMAQSIDAVRGGLPWQVTLASMSLLTSHDTARWRDLARTDALAFVGVGMLMTLPGSPTFFYGDEVGLTGGHNETARRPMPWDTNAWDTTFLDWYRSLIAMRSAHPCLHVGGFRWVDVQADAVAFLRETLDERLLIRAARSATQPVELDVVALGGSHLTSLLDGPDLESTDLDDGRVLRLPGDGPGFSVWKVEP